MQTIKTQRPSWPDNTIYFLTDSTYLHYPYFRTDEQKQIVLNQIKDLNKKLGIPISAYSIAVNHYHLKFFLKYGRDLSKVKQILRGGISYEYRKKFKVPYKEMWQTRKIIAVTSEDMDLKVTGYIIGNLLKHKEVSTFSELKDNPFSSYRYMVEKYNEEEVKELVREVIVIEEGSWGSVDVKNFNKIKIRKF